ncbi:MAG: hypothetical protein JWO57_3375 [Pseudonocardiales bacterium]|nr:hypothetical protein [Pseudonocardiales bacterium]
MRTGGSHRASRHGGRDAAGHVEHLARFSGAPLTDPVAFGGGADLAMVGLRAQTVAYGYLGVVEEYEHPTTGAQWCTLTVSLPNTVAFLALDHRSALGQRAVPVPGDYLSPTGFADLDATYVVTADVPDTVVRLLGPELREVVLRSPVQRLMFAGSRLLLRSFDGPGATPEVTEWLDALASEVLAATPAFVSRVMSPDAGPVGLPFPPGLYGPSE